MPTPPKDALEDLLYLCETGTRFDPALRVKPPRRLFATGLPTAKQLRYIRCLIKGIEHLSEHLHPTVCTLSGRVPPARSVAAASLLIQRLEDLKRVLEAPSMDSQLVKARLRELCSP